MISGGVEAWKHPNLNFYVRYGKYEFGMENSSLVWKIESLVWKIKNCWDPRVPIFVVLVRQGNNCESTRVFSELGAGTNPRRFFGGFVRGR